MNDCLDDDAIANLRAGVLDDDERAAVTAHLDGCGACHALVADAARARPPIVAELPAPRIPGAALGRYLILETVGAGAMGVVYAAYDPELRRKVALKLLRNDPFAKGSSSAQRPRLLREAQSLAKLSHPNVITLFDVGVIDDEVFLAMELVEEGTLGDWLRASKRTWRAVLEMMRQAGEGLAAAHAAGLVHRDFKPENVLVGADGRAKVTDFGLAREHALAGNDVAPSVDTVGSLDAVTGESKLTLTGAVLGTPAYMAPELGRGGVADARSDQFAFCATLYEALYGERPFAGTDAASLASDIARHAVRSAPSSMRVPAWIRTLVTRGLRADPDERFPSMRALLDALAKGPLLSPRRVGVAIVACTLLGLGGALASARLQAPAACTGDDAAWGDVFSAADLEAIHRVFTATHLPSADESFASAQRDLDARRSAWTAMRHEACMGRVQGTQSEAMLDLRMVCFESRRRETAVLVAVLSTADAKTVTSARAAIDALPSVASCAETQELTAMDPPPKDPAKRAELTRLEGEVTRVVALETASRWTEATAVLDALLPAAQALDYRPMQARAAYARGMSRVHTVAGKEDLNEASLLALNAHDDATLADAWIALARTCYPIAPKEGVMWTRYAEAALARLGGDESREVHRLKWLAMNLEIDGRLEEAEVYARRDVALATKLYGPDDPRVITPNEVVDNVLVAEDHLDEALLVERRVLAGRARVDGPESPSLLVSSLNEGEILDLMARPDEALAIYRRVLAKWEAGPYGSWAHAIVGAALRHRGLYGEALAEDQHALELAKKEDASNKDLTSRPFTGIGLDELALGRPREALPSLEAAVATAYGDEDFTEEALLGLAQAVWDSGGDKARAHQTAAIAREKVRERAEKFGGRFRRQLDAVDAWAERHPSSPVTGAPASTTARKLVAQAPQ